MKDAEVFETSALAKEASPEELWQRKSLSL